MASHSDSFILFEVRFPKDAFSLASLVLRWLEPRLAPLLDKLEPECLFKPLLWQGRCIKAGDLEDSLYQVFYAISLKSDSNHIDGLLEEYSRYLDAQPMVKDNAQLLSIYLRRAERSEVPVQILEHQQWLTVEATSFTKPATLDAFDTSESAEDCNIPDPVDISEGHTSEKSARPINADSGDFSTAPKPGRKFRPEREVMSRIRHDPTFSVDDFLVGYEDRFTGIMEIPLSDWKADTTEDEFIPLHRIVHFRKKDTRKIVWDRRRRIDLVWG